MSTETVIKELKALKEGDEILSPEGADEKVVESQAFVITLTANGKYRLYFAGKTGEFTPAPDLASTKEIATKGMSTIQMLMSSMEINPQRTMDVMLRALDKRAGK